MERSYLGTNVFVTYFPIHRVGSGPAVKILSDGESVSEAEGKNYFFGCDIWEDKAVFFAVNEGFFPFSVRLDEVSLSSDAPRGVARTRNCVDPKKKEIGMEFWSPDHLCFGCFRKYCSLIPKQRTHMGVGASIKHLMSGFRTFGARFAQKACKPTPAPKAITFLKSDAAPFFHFYPLLAPAFISRLFPEKASNSFFSSVVVAHVVATAAYFSDCSLLPSLSAAVRVSIFKNSPRVPKKAGIERGRRTRRYIRIEGLTKKTFRKPGIKLQTMIPVQKAKKVLFSARTNKLAAAP